MNGRSHIATSPVHSIRTIITPDRIRSYRNKQRLSNVRKDYSHLITITPSRKTTCNVSTNQLMLPRVLASNVRAITKAKHAELLIASADFDIIMITESWLKPHKTKAFSIPGFRLLNVDRSEKRAGGVCMYIRETLSAAIVSEYTSTNVSTMWVAFHQDSLPPIIYATIYHPPNLPKAICESTIDHITATVSQLSSRYHNAKFIIYGDFNDLDTQPITDLFAFHQLVTFPTRGEKTIDLVFSDIDEYTKSPETTCLQAAPIGESDHNSIELTTKLRPKHTYTTVLKRVITEKCKIGISSDLQHQTWDSVTAESDASNKAAKFQEVVTTIVDKWCPKRKVRTPINKDPITTPLIAKLRRAKQKAFRKGCKSWKYFSKLLKQKLSEIQGKQVETKIHNVTSGTSSWWKSIKQVTGEHKTNRATPYINIENEWLDKKEFCERLNEYYVSMGENMELSTPDLPANCSMVPNCVSEWEVHKELQKIKTHKATHSSDFPSWVTRDNAELLAKPIADIINSILTTGCYPSVWKAAEITPLPKTNCPKTYKDYRPIALLFHVGKIAERFMNRELSKHLVDKKQYAYTKGVGTTDALVKLVTDVVTSLDHKSTYAVQSLCLDFSKAFDLMRPDTLAKKLLKQNVAPLTVKLVTDFLSERSQCVKIEETKSAPLRTKLGVPQGTISGPILWNLFVQDLDPTSNTLKYADDTTLYMLTEKESVSTTNETGRNRDIDIVNNPLQLAADRASLWSAENHQRLNATKTQYMAFTLQLNVKLTTPININGEEIAQSSETKLLGVYLDNHLSFSHHVTKTIEKTRSAVHGLLTLKRHGAKEQVLVKFYQARIQPILTYAAPAWCPYTSAQSRAKLSRHQSLCLRIIYPPIKSLTERLHLANIKPICETLDSLCSSYARKIAQRTTHRLHHLIPVSRSTATRSSMRLAGTTNRKISTRTEKLNKSLFMNYV